MCCYQDSISDVASESGILDLHGEIENRDDIDEGILGAQSDIEGDDDAFGAPSEIEEECMGWEAQGEDSDSDIFSDCFPEHGASDDDNGIIEEAQVMVLTPPSDFIIASCTMPLPLGCMNIFCTCLDVVLIMRRRTKENKGHEHVYACLVFRHY